MFNVVLNKCIYIQQAVQCDIVFIMDVHIELDIWIASK